LGFRDFKEIIQEFFVIFRGWRPAGLSGAAAGAASSAAYGILVRQHLCVKENPWLGEELWE
jgi:hypothetical protein